MAAALETKPDIILNSPVGAKAAIYKWPSTCLSKGQKIDCAGEEIVETIRWVAHEYLEFKPAIENLLRDQPNLRNYDCIKSLCDKYNKITEMVLKMNKGTSVAPKTSSRASQGLLKHIIQQVYNYAVADPTELNKYSPFSSETYGETNFEFMAQLIEKNQFRPKENDTFIDMGSGVGHLVLQVAASVECKKCYGIEISDVPAGYARVMEERFKFWMNWHGKTYTEFELHHGDFFERKYADIIRNASYILVNNYAFKPEVDHKLKEMFMDLNDGVQILSSKPFCSQKTRLTERRVTNDLASIMKVEALHPEQKKDTVSWTHKPLPYYRHILDASRVTKYYERLQRRRQSRSVEKGKPSKRRRIGDITDSDDDADDKVVYGPTTRRAWNEQCSATNAIPKTSADSVKTVSSRNNSTDTEHYESSIETADSGPIAKSKENETSHKRERKNDTQNVHTDKQNQGSLAQNKGSGIAIEKTEAKSCLDKKRDYAIKKTGATNILQNAPPSALYSISKPSEASNGTSTSKIPNIVIKVKPPTVDEDDTLPSTANDSPSKDKQEFQESKTNENNKKLRQRKKSNTENTLQAKEKPPVTRTPREATRKAQAAKNASKPAAKTTKAATGANSILSTTSVNTTRTKKTAPISTKPSATTKTQASSKRKANPSERGSSLDLLHAKTVESVTGNAGYFPLPAPGCEDHSLRSITETPSLPKVVIKDLSMFVNDFLGQKTVEKFTDCIRHELDMFARKLERPGIKEALSREIDRERARQRVLARERDDLCRDIKNLVDRIPRAMKVHCDDLGIKNTSRSIVAHLGALLKKHQDLMAYQLQLEAALHTNQRTMNPPAAHSNGGQCLSSPYRSTSSSATLDLSLKPVA